MHITHFDSTKGLRGKTFAVFVFLEPLIFSANFKIFRRLEIFSASFCVILMQTRKFFCEYSHGDLTAKVLSRETFVLYSIFQNFYYFRLFVELQNCAQFPSDFYYLTIIMAKILLFYTY